jgi:hypothetical protein
LESDGEAVKESARYGDGGEAEPVEAEHLSAALYVWEGEDGPGIRAAVGAPYRTVAR